MPGSPERIPERMLRRGRPVFDQFDDREMLYHRVNRATVTWRDNMQFFLNVRMPNTSVNRTWPDGQWDDVLFERWPEYEQWGVIGFEVRIIPSPHIRDAGAALNYRVVHDPEEHNYYHSEIRVYREGDREPLPHLNKGQKLWFRMELSQRLNRSNVLREPKV